METAFDAARREGIQVRVNVSSNSGNNNTSTPSVSSNNSNSSSTSKDTGPNIEGYSGGGSSVSYDGERPKDLPVDFNKIPIDGGGSDKKDIEKKEDAIDYNDPDKYKPDSMKENDIGDLKLEKFKDDLTTVNPGLKRHGEDSAIDRTYGDDTSRGTINRDEDITITEAHKMGIAGHINEAGIRSEVTISDVHADENLRKQMLLHDTTDGIKSDEFKESIQTIDDKIKEEIEDIEKNAKEEAERLEEELKEKEILRFEEEMKMLAKGGSANLKDATTKRIIGKLLF